MLLVWLGVVGNGGEGGWWMGGGASEGGWWWALSGLAPSEWGAGARAGLLKLKAAAMYAARGCKSHMGGCARGLRGGVGVD